ncbi:MAG: hypothetical protein GF334_01100 [Candidatus Altiarchaeales archaeon]|nr:hypothetical protein [Candidatus Altiarchaeales archaeon]
MTSYPDYTEEELYRFADLVAQSDMSFFYTFEEEYRACILQEMRVSINKWGTQGNECALLRFMRKRFPGHRSLRTTLKPLEEMPPLVEDRDDIGRLSLDALIARWRLEIGR